MSKISRHRVLLLFIFTPLLLFIQLAIGFAVYTSIHHMRQVEAQNARLDTYLRTNTKYMSMAESAQRGYLLTGDNKYKENFALSIGEIEKNELGYDLLLTDSRRNPITIIRNVSGHKVSEMSQTISLYEAGQKEEALSLVKTNVGKLMMDSIRSATTSIRTSITDQVARQRVTEDKLFIIFFIVIAILIAFNLFLVYYTYRKFTEYARNMETLVDSLEDANARMREYTNMSYHELKTPLRSIHGFAQLLKVRHLDGEEEAEGEEFVRYITDGISQMNKTIDRMRSKYLDSSEKN